MSNNNYLLNDDALASLLTTIRRRLAHLRQQEATFGLDTRPHIKIEIEDTEKDVQGIVDELVRRGVDPGVSDGNGRLLEPFLERVIQSCNALAFSDPHAGKPGRQPMRLAQVFTMLMVTAREGVLRVLHALDDTPSCVLLGEPGGGKSTVVNFLAAALAEASQGYENGLTRLGNDWTAGPLLPVRVRLKEVTTNLWEAAPDVQSANLKPDDRRTLIALLERCLRVGTAMLLLDGLDEVTTEDRLAAVQNLIAAARHDYRKSRLVVSCRVFDYRNEPGRRIANLSEIQLQRFDAKGQASFVARWYDELAAIHPDLWPAESVQQKRDDLQTALETRPELAEMAGNPLLLALIALVHTRDGDLPPARSLLYQRCVRTLLWDWRGDERGALLEEGRLLRLMAELGYQAHAAEEQEGRAFRGLSYRAVHDTALNFFTRGKSGQVERQKGEDEAREAGRRLLNSNGLLLELGGDRYGFAHRSLQHFLAGQYLGGGGDIVEALSLAANDHWRIAFHLLAGYEAREGNRFYALQLIEELIRRGTHEVILAGEMLLEIGRQVLLDNRCGHVLASGGLWQRLSAELRRRAFSNPPIELDPRLRNRAAELLALLGEDNQRLGLRLAQPDYWAARIEPGTFLMEEEAAAFEFTISRPYSLARFPVTNRQYGQFLATLSKAEAKHHRPSEWKSESYSTGDDNYPVVNITWENACVFAHWANQTFLTSEQRASGNAIRLPTEPEWERATTKGNDKTYPWGDDWRENYANTKESGLDGNSVVGIFPQGAATCGAEELAGNVWEWCSTPYQYYPLQNNLQPETIYTTKNWQQKTYVLRGGSWHYNHNHACCTCRVHFNPKLEVIDHGFRLARIFPLE